MAYLDASVNNRVRIFLKFNVEECQYVNEEIDLHQEQSRPQLMIVFLQLKSILNFIDI